MHILDMCPACGVSQLKCTSILLNRQSRFVPRMWSCLASFIEPGESLEEAVRRETWEETGIEVGEVIYHSSQPWPIGLGHVPCQLMVGFFAYAKTLEINVDKEELEDAQWHIREDVSKALIFAEYKKTQLTAAAKVEQYANGSKKGKTCLQISMSKVGNSHVESFKIYGSKTTPHTRTGLGCIGK